MSDPRIIADRIEIEALRLELAGRDRIRAGIGQLREHWEFFVQNTHPGTIRLDGDTATGRASVMDLGRFRDGGSHRNHAIYHDRYRRAADGWKFAERRYEVRYHDTTDLPGTSVNQVMAKSDHAR